MFIDLDNKTLSLILNSLFSSELVKYIVSIFIDLDNKTGVKCHFFPPIKRRPMWISYQSRSSNCRVTQPTKLSLMSITRSLNASSRAIIFL